MAYFYDEPGMALSESEKKSLITQSENRYPVELSLSWRILHFVCYVTGGVTFFVGSFSYYPTVATFNLGGWLYTIGSFGFLLADGLEWWTNNRVGCFAYSDLAETYELEIADRNYNAVSTWWGLFQRSANGLNFFFSLCGSALYLMGSILFIPATDSLLGGTELFIVGSMVIFLSQFWKVARAGCSNGNIPSDKSFSIINYLADIPAFLVDAAAGLGGLCYFVGSVYFLPQYDVSPAVTHAAARWFVSGGTFFTLSGLAIFYRYFCTTHWSYESHASQGGNNGHNSTIRSSRALEGRESYGTA